MKDIQDVNYNRGLNLWEKWNVATIARLNGAWNRIRNIQRPIKDLAPKYIKMGQIVSEATYLEYMNGKTVQRRILYLPMPYGCAWRFNGSSGCFNCGMAAGAGVRPFPAAVIKSIVDKILEIKLKGKVINWFNIYIEGSFLNDLEIPPLAQETILKLIATETDTERITIETRPEYITDKKVDMIDKIATEYDIEFEIGIGVETSNDFLRHYCINKGFTFQDFTRKAELLHTARNVRVLAYKLFKPIFLDESEAIEDAVESITAYSDIADVISIETAGIQEYTILEYLWLRGDYNLPWLWSVLEVMNKIKTLIESKSVEIRLGGEPKSYYPASKTTAYNCEKCSERVWKRIRQYNETHDIRVLETHCECQETWVSQVKNKDEGDCIEDGIIQRIIEISKNLSYEDYLEKKGLQSSFEVL